MTNTTNVWVASVVILGVSNVPALSAKVDKYTYGSRTTYHLENCSGTCGTESTYGAKGDRCIDPKKWSTDEAWLSKGVTFSGWQTAVRWIKTNTIASGDVKTRSARSI